MAPSFRQQAEKMDKIILRLLLSAANGVLWLLFRDIKSQWQFLASIQLYLKSREKNSKHSALLPLQVQSLQ